MRICTGVSMLQRFAGLLASYLFLLMSMISIVQAGSDTPVATGNSHLPDPRLAGGATTVFDQSRNAYSLPANNTSLLRRDDFFIGNAFFQQPWVIAPSSTRARDGLGPLFNTNSCQSCHVKDGRGQPPIHKDDPFLSTLVRLSIPASTPEEQALLRTHGIVPEPVYGDQLQPRALPGLPAEASPRFVYTEIKGSFQDGETYTLLQPEILIESPHYGALHKDVQYSARVAPAMIGLGLLEAIAEEDILAAADPDDANQDGISGRVNRVWDAQAEKTVLGRFGWKANQPNIAQQSAGAFNGDLGITSALFPASSCTAQQTNCLKAPHGGEPEISAEIMEKVTFYASLLAVPARRDVDNPQVLEGQRLFQQAGCVSCHTPAFTTGSKDGFPELEKQSIQPFTDLLLHDMGSGLADGRPDFDASGSEWRTPPLWGIGLVETVNGHTRFLHDGRARNLLEAILWHGGEATAAQQKVRAMNKTERAALLRFLHSL